VASSDNHSFRRFVAPRYWPTWALWATLKLLSYLPLRLQFAFGTYLGHLLFAVLKRQRHIAETNLAICFPELSAARRYDLLRSHFVALGISFIEMSIAWFSPIERLRKLIRVNGEEHLRAAIARDRPVLLWGAHFTCLEIGVTLLADYTERCATMYRSQRNPMMDALIRRGRSRFAAEQISRDDIRRLLKRLKEGYAVVYFPDQTYVGNQSALLPFFGEPAMVNTATSKLANMANATVLTYFYRRLPDNSGYVLEIGPPLGNVPSNDPIADARALSSALEDFIRLAPEQYLWTYKKFKRRPVEFSDPYQKPPA